MFPQTCLIFFQINTKLVIINELRKKDRPLKIGGTDTRAILPRWDSRSMLMACGGGLPQRTDVQRLYAGSGWTSPDDVLEDQSVTCFAFHTY